MRRRPLSPLVDRPMLPVVLPVLVLVLVVHTLMCSSSCDPRAMTGIRVIQSTCQAARIEL